MAALSYSRLFAPQQLGTSASSLFVLSSGTLRNLSIKLVNTTGGAIQVTGYLIPSGGSASDTTTFLKDESIAANSYIEVNVPKMITSDDLQMLASAAASITVYELDGVVRT